MTDKTLLDDDFVEVELNLPDDVIEFIKAKADLAGLTFNQMISAMLVLALPLNKEDK